jgi:hypothetical protein
VLVVSIPSRNLTSVSEMSWSDQYGRPGEKAGTTVSVSLAADGGLSISPALVSDCDRDLVTLSVGSARAVPFFGGIGQH